MKYIYIVVMTFSRVIYLLSFLYKLVTLANVICACYHLKKTSWYSLILRRTSYSPMALHDIDFLSVKLPVALTNPPVTVLMP